MVIDLQKFIASERPYWAEFEGLLERMEVDHRLKLPLAGVRRFHYLYERTAAGLARINTFASEPETRRYLESLLARAYGEMHDGADRRQRPSLAVWFLQRLPQTFRRHVQAFWLTVAVTAAGILFGGLAMTLDPDAKAAILPEAFAGHLNDPVERVAREEKLPHQANAGQMTSFSAQLMVNNISVSIKALALGMTWGIGTLAILFYNGVILGLIGADYIQAGQTVFLLGWLLPHGVIEIPAVLIGGQAGFVLAGALIGWGRRETLRARLRAITPDLTTLIFGVALMLVWAGLVEAFFSQYHAPVLPYSVKIAFGGVEFALLLLFFARAGRQTERTPAEQRP